MFSIVSVRDCEAVLVAVGSEVFVGESENVRVMVTSGVLVRDADTVLLTVGVGVLVAVASTVSDADLERVSDPGETDRREITS